MVDTLFSDFIGAFGVVPAPSGAAGEFALALLTGATWSEAITAAEQELAASPAIDNAVDVSVTAAVAELLSDQSIWAAVDTTLTTLVTDVLGDEPVQQAVGTWVANAVNERLGFGPISVVGDLIGDAVVALITNPVVQTGLIGVVDTLVSDFWGTAGVVTAFSEAAGTLAKAALVGDLDTVFPRCRRRCGPTPTCRPGPGIRHRRGGAVPRRHRAVVRGRPDALGDDRLADQRSGGLDAIGTAVSDLVVTALGEPWARRSARRSATR